MARGHETRGASYTGGVTIHCGGTRDSLCDTLRYTTGRWTRLLRVMHMGAPHVYVRARAAGPRVRDGMSGCGGLRGARRGGDFARARWRLPSRRVGLISEGVPDGVLGDDRLFTCRCGAAQLGSPQDAPSWSGLPKQLGHARPRAHMLAEASFPRRYPGRASPVRGLSGGPYTP